MSYRRGSELGFFLMITLTCGAVIILGTGFLIRASLSGSPSTSASEGVASQPVSAQGSSDVELAASQLARADNAGNSDTYAQELTRLTARCSESLSELVSEINSAQAALAQEGWPNTRLSLLQGVDSLAYAASDPGRVLCKTVLDAAVSSLKGSGGQSPQPSPVSTAPQGYAAAPTAVCKDGTYSYSQHRQGTCSHHGGVTQWLQ